MPMGTFSMATATTTCSADSGGADLLRGGAGSDDIHGGVGTDRLIGGLGNDTLAGDADADRFVFNTANDGTDLINGFSMPDGDRIEINKNGSGFTGLVSLSSARCVAVRRVERRRGQQLRRRHRRPGHLRARHHAGARRAHQRVVRRQRRWRGGSEAPSSTPPRSWASITTASCSHSRAHPGRGERKVFRPNMRGSTSPACRCQPALAQRVFVENARAEG